MLRLAAALTLAATVALAALAALAVAQARGREAHDAGAILVLGASMTPDGRLSPAGRARVDTGVALWRQGRAPVLVMSGGPAVPGGVSAGARMAARAARAGVPAAALRVEGRAQSTLQNMALARPLLDGAPVILVTHGYHMARARASAAWAGVAVAGWAAPAAFTRGRAGLRDLAREALAIPFNLARVAAWHALGRAGVAEEARMRLLARAAHRPPDDA